MSAAAATELTEVTVDTATASLSRKRKAKEATIRMGSVTMLMPREPFSAYSLRRQMAMQSKAMHSEMR